MESHSISQTVSEIYVLRVGGLKKMAKFHWCMDGEREDNLLRRGVGSMTLNYVVTLPSTGLSVSTAWLLNHLTGPTICGQFPAPADKVCVKL